MSHSKVRQVLIVFGLSLLPHLLTYGRGGAPTHQRDQREHTDPKSHPEVLKPDLCPGTDAEESRQDTTIHHGVVMVLHSLSVEERKYFTARSKKKKKKMLEK